MTFRFFHDFGRLPFPKRRLVEAGRRVCATEGVPSDRQTHVILCSNARIRLLNRDFRGLDRATDVLSFVYGDEDLLGEIYLSLEKAATQARQFGVTYEEEVLRLFIHGLLHLLGYDHFTVTQRSAMRALENRYLGVGKVGRAG